MKGDWEKQVAFQAAFNKMIEGVEGCRLLRGSRARLYESSTPPRFRPFLGPRVRPVAPAGPGSPYPANQGPLRSVQVAPRPHLLSSATNRQGLKAVADQAYPRPTLGTMQGKTGDRIRPRSKPRSRNARAFVPYGNACCQSAGIRRRKTSVTKPPG